MKIKTHNKLFIYLYEKTALTCKADSKMYFCFTSRYFYSQVVFLLNMIAGKKNPDDSPIRKIQFAFTQFSR